MKKYLLVLLFIYAAFAAPNSIVDQDESADVETDIQSAQFMNPMMMGMGGMNPMMMGGMNPMMMGMNPMMGMMGGSCGGGCSCSGCSIPWLCRPLCNPCCCNGSGCDDTTEQPPKDKEPPKEEEPLFPDIPLFPDMHVREDGYPHYIPESQYPPDIIVRW